ncbi:MAG: LCP family protein [Spirochaetales bacterium]|nr:LCP family protein [Spirochaetales bacterium]
MRTANTSSGLPLVILIVLIIAGGSAVLFFQLRTDKVSELLGTKDVLHTLIFITEDSRVISTQLFLYSKVTYKGALLDIPSKTGSLLESKGKIGSIETLYSPGKPSAFIAEIVEILGIPVDVFIRMEVQNFVKFIDLIEGIEIFIPNPVENIEDGQTVLLPSGNLVLDGSKVLEYLVYEESSDSYTDIAARRQKIFQGLFRSIGKNTQMLSHDKVRPYVRDLVDANVSEKGLTVLFDEMASLDTERFVFLQLRGASRMVDNESLLFPYSDGNLIRETLRQTLASLVNEDVFSDEELNVRIEVLNGTNQNGLATRTSQIFQSFGYEIKNIGNAETIYEKTTVIDRKGDVPAAQRLAKIIQCSNVVSETPAEDAQEEINATDITIIIGKDFDGRYCKE